MTPEECAQRQQDGGWWEDQLVGRCTFPLAPVNTWTNAAYVLAGWLGFHWRDTGAGLVFALLMTALGLGSGLYHGLKTPTFDRMDEAGMYAVLSALVTYALAPSGRDIAWAMLAVSASVVLWVAYGRHGGDWLDPLTGAFIAVVALSLYLHGHTLVATVGVAVLGAAYTVWHMDQDRTFWWPYWGHGLWHVGTAAGLLVLFLGLA